MVHTDGPHGQGVGALRHVDHLGGRARGRQGGCDRQRRPVTSPTDVQDWKPRDMNRKARRAAKAKNAPVGSRPTIEATLSEGVRHHQAGRLQQAEKCYRAALQQQPDTPIAQGYTDALHLLGVVQMQSGQLDEAVASISRAVRRSP